MAGQKMISFAVLGVALFLGISAQESETEELSRCIPGSPWCPVWVPCNYTEVQGPTCQDCNTRLICTAVGGLVKPCLFPGTPNCVNGRCVAQPSEECAGTTESSAQ